MPGGVRGRRVTEIHPVDRRAYPREYESSVNDLQKAWDTLGKAKSSFRHVEHRLEDVERHAALTRRDITPINQSDSSVIVGRIPSFEISDHASSHPYTEYQKKAMKPSNPRKISRIGDKYSDQEALGGDELDYSPTRGDRSPLKHVDFNDQPQYRHIEGRNSEPLGYTYNDSTEMTTNTTLTDSRAIRETEIKFLNDHIAPSTGGESLHRNLYERPTKLTHVDMPESFRHTKSAIEGSSTKENQHTTSHEASSSLESNSNSSSRSLRVKKSIQELKNDENAMNKLKEKIRQQRINVAQQKQENDPVNVSERLQHSDTDPVLSKTYDVIDMPANTQPITRKIAAGPSTPSYRGFTDPEALTRTPDGKIVKLADRKKFNQSKKATDLSEPKQKKERLDVKKKVHEANKPSKFRKDVITTRSWREGQKLIRRELGPSHPVRSDSPPTRDRDEPSESNSIATEKSEEATVPPGERGAVPSVDKSQEEFIDSLEPSKAKALSDQAKGVLADLHSESGSDDEEKQEKIQKEKRKTKLLKRKASNRPVEEEKKFPVSKVRHYDTDEVRQYMAKKAITQKKQKFEERKKQKEAQETKEKALDELYKKQKETAKKPIKYLMKPHRPQRGGRPAANDRTAANSNDTFSKGPSLADLPKRHPFHDYQNKGSTENLDMERSDSESSTLTGESTIDVTLKEDSLSMREGDQKAGSASSDASLNVDEIITKYSHEIPEIQKLKEKVKEIQSGAGYEMTTAPSGDIRQSTVPSTRPKRPDRQPYADRPSQHGHMTKSHDLPHREAPTSLPPRDFQIPTAYRAYQPKSHEQPLGHKGQPISRVERIMAIQNEATSLKTRLQDAEQRIMSGAWTLPGQVGNLDDQWSKPRGQEFSTDFTSRHDRITKPSKDYTVFTHNLPGVGNVAEHTRKTDEHKMEDEAARRIQAAYRGHTVRQSLNWKLPSGQAVLHRKGFTFFTTIWCYLGDLRIAAEVLVY